MGIEVTDSGAPWDGGFLVCGYHVFCRVIGEGAFLRCRLVPFRRGYMDVTYLVESRGRTSTLERDLGASCRGYVGIVHLVGPWGQGSPLLRGLGRLVNVSEDSESVTS